MKRVVAATGAMVLFLCVVSTLADAQTAVTLGYSGAGISTDLRKVIQKTGLWAKRGLDVHVLTTESNTWTHEVPFTVHPIMRDWSWRDLPRVARFVKRCAPDHVFLFYIGWVYNFPAMITFAPTICRALLPPHHFVTMFAYPMAYPMGSKFERVSIMTRAIRKAMQWMVPSVPMIVRHRPPLQLL